jgi:hypothetical protein
MSKTNNDVIGLIDVLSSHTDSRNLKATYFAARNIHACRAALTAFSELAKPYQAKMLELERGPLALRAAAKAAIEVPELKEGDVDQRDIDALDEQYATEIAEHAAAVAAINELLALDCEVSAYTLPGQSLPDGVFSTADLVVFLEHGLID